MRLSTLAPLLAALPSTMAVKPVKPVITNTTGLPMHFGLLVFPSFQALDVFGPMDVLNSLSLLFKLPLKLSVLAATMDPVSTSPAAAVGMANMSHNDFGESIMPTITFADYLAGHEMKHVKRHEGHDGHGDGGHNKKACAEKGMDMDKGDIEVLIIPGGGGTRGNLTEQIAFVKAMYPKVKYILTVCTGATLASRAGILDGRKATTNKLAWTWATSTGPNTNWIGKARWVDDGNIWSSSGISAGSDMMYAWVAATYGDDVAQYLSMVAEYTRWEDANNDPFADIWEVV